MTSASAAAGRLALSERGSGRLAHAATARLQQLFEGSSDASPDAIALECGPQRLTYRELDRRANRLAHRLIGLGIRPGGRVGILLERSVETYVSVLAVLKAGGVFVPVDQGTPPERVGYISEDAELSLLLTSSDLRSLSVQAACRVLELDRDAASLASLAGSRPSIAAEADAPCYVIYTSGSTGRPKGVEVAHSNIVNFLRAARDVYGLTPSDRVYQGMSVAFDFSCEEIWVPWTAGATVVAGPNDERRLGPGLAEFLAARRITVLCCVPTLLGTLDRDLPLVRLLLVGGETCPEELVARWSTPDRRMLNSYGPAEATVTALVSELVPDRPVTIGRPMPTYTAYVLDDGLRPVPAGQVGEICIGGPGVALGYLGRPELTAERFVPDPYAEVPGARLFRTGDLGRVRDDGEIEFLGRSDLQVKLRGYRIDLGEIEAVLREDRDVSGAVVVVHQSPGLGPELAAYVTVREPLDPAGVTQRLHARLRERLPAYMVPSFLDVLDAIPRLMSGKPDRANLPEPVARLGAAEREYVAPSSPAEERLARVWAHVLGRERVSVIDDFFLDLGGHSLAAAILVSALRSEPDLGGAAIADVYAHPTVRELASCLRARSERTATDQPVVCPSDERTTTGRQVLGSGLWQLVALYLIAAIAAAPIAWLFHHYHGHASWGLLWASVAMFPGLVIAFSLVVPLLGSRLLLAGMEPGRYPLWGATYLRFWAARRLLAFSPLAVLSGSPLMPAYLRLLGARVGARCMIATPNLALPRFTSLGDDVSLGPGALLQPFAVEAGWLTIAPVEIADHAFVGTGAVVLAGARLGAHCGLSPQSLAHAGVHIAAGEWWAGSPATPAEKPDSLVLRARYAPEPPDSWSKPLIAGYFAGFLGLELLPWVAFAAPVALVIWVFETAGMWAALASALGAALLYVLSVCMLVAAGVRIASRGIRPGVFPLRSAFGLRKWTIDRLLDASLALTNSLYGTLYAMPWLRALGASVGHRSEISTIAHVDPVLLTLGTESFAADMATIGPATFVDGRIVLGRTEIGTRSFVGNAGLVRGGSTVQDGSLIGAHTVSPETVPKGSSWLGSPPIFLPRRQPSGEYPERLTYRPSRGRVAARLAIEYFRVTLPASLLGAAALLEVLAIMYLAARERFLTLWALLPLLALAGGVLVLLAVVVLKWAIVGSYRPRVEPLWATFVRRTELITALYETAAVPVLISLLLGTPLIRPALGLLGARIGRRVWIDTSYLTEFDLVRVGDAAAVGGFTSLQTHLFEDRVMKMSQVDVGEASTVGPRTIVLYDSHIGEHAVLDALSLAMKGETLPARTRWRGIPASGA